jgi:hypothetical protein
MGRHGPISVRKPRAKLPSRSAENIQVNRVTMGGLACGLALLLLTTACGNGLSTNGPFGSTIPASGNICAHARPGGVAYSGFEDFPNSGGTATIDKVKLAQARHLRLVTAWVLPISNPNEGVGVGGGYPNASSVASDAPGVLWDRRQQIPGAVVRHTHGQERINLVIVAKPTGKDGTSTAVDLYYESGGTHYLLHFPYGFEVKVARTC